MTGAPVPDGAGAIVMVEKTTVDGDIVTVEALSNWKPHPASGRRCSCRREGLAAGDAADGVT